MTTPYLAKSLELFKASIDTAFPFRDKGSDGWIGNAAHAATQSEHNPDSRGCVHAIDVDVDDNDVQRDLRLEVLDATVGHPAVWYVISNGIIQSRTHNWEKRTYTGDNPHKTHVHISIQLTSVAENNLTLKLKRFAQEVDMKATDPVPGLKDPDGTPITWGEMAARSSYLYYQNIGKLEDYKKANPSHFPPAK